MTAGRADRIDMLLASPRRAKQPGTGMNRILRSDAGGHWRDLTGPRTAAHRSASTASEPDLPSSIARRAPSAREANVTRYIEVPATEHVMGGMPMGTNARTSVTDEQGRHHHLDNLFVADGAVFPTSGGHNPTLTIMATALRQATAWAGT
ncbi:MAG: GMC family oxidoreductase [Acidimicrobiales bacterium]